jgi:hypothetical protein
VAHGLSYVNYASFLSSYGGYLGQHYAALYASASTIHNTKLSASVMALANVADFSGYVKPTLSYSFFDQLSASVWGSFTFGDAGDEYTNMSMLSTAVTKYMMNPSYDGSDLTPSMSLGLTVSFGTSSF